MRKLPLLIACLLTSLNTHADGPNYQVFPQIKNLKISYHVESRKKLTTIYATNHEKSTIVCDAMLLTNKQDKIKKQETPVAAQQTISFSFKHGIAITDVRIYLMCEADKESEKTVESKESNSNQTSSENRSLDKKSSIVIEEDIGNMQ